MTDAYLKAEVEQMRLALNRLLDECDKLDSMIAKVESYCKAQDRQPATSPGESWQTWDE